MGLGLILDDLCVFVGVAILWLLRGCRYSLWQEMKTVKAGDFWSRREGIIGLVALVAMVAAVALVFVLCRYL